MKIIFHIDEPGKWPIVLENLKNVLNNAKETNRTYELEVLANSMAVFQLKEVIARNTNLIDKIIEPAEQGVVFAVCNNSLKKFNIAKNELFSFCKVVPTGIIELAEKQSEGYLYIKP
ncbi:DsrE family protein [Clostridium sp. LIBA-8841]|uniref:DsrE family protein n=1 Tax=Clostridium sp. LIBA-8841 TaxID=2987530 RepID=UPI002AC38CC2|nr:DsrE family protein [Clostridium sp. LIBA-8841]MDZ5255121.1 DsrE family protein [Clostridium sp. LIBA-8841]